MCSLDWCQVLPRPFWRDASSTKFVANFKPYTLTNVSVTRTAGFDRRAYRNDDSVAIVARADRGSLEPLRDEKQHLRYSRSRLCTSLNLHHLRSSQFRTLAINLLW